MEQFKNTKHKDSRTNQPLPLVLDTKYLYVLLSTGQWSWCPTYSLPFTPRSICTQRRPISFPAVTSISHAHNCTKLSLVPHEPHTVVCLISFGRIYMLLVARSTYSIWLHCPTLYSFMHQSRVQKCSHWVTSLVEHHCICAFKSEGLSRTKQYTACYS